MDLDFSDEYRSGVPIQDEHGKTVYGIDCTKRLKTRFRSIDVSCGKSYLSGYTTTYIGTSCTYTLEIIDYNGVGLHGAASSFFCTHFAYLSKHR